MTWALVAGLGSAAACGSSETEAPERSTSFTPPDLPTLARLPAASLASQRASLEHASERDSGDRELGLARIARILALKGAEEELDTASRWYRAAASSPATDCPRLLEWARFEARDRARSDMARAVGERALAVAQDGSPCRAQVLWLLPMLDALREPTQVLPQPTPSGPLVIDRVLRHRAGTEAVRYVFGLSRMGPFRVVETETDTDRVLTLQVDGATMQDSARMPGAAPQAGVRRVALEATSDGDIAVRFHVDNTVAHQAYLLSDPFRLVLDVHPRRGQGKRAEPLRVIVLDPGHGGEDLGAHRGGLRESDLALQLAQRAAGYLEEWLPEVRVLLTRRRDGAMSLEDRVAFANDVSADVFVSIHLNGWDEQLTRGGVTTFVLDASDDQASLELAARENRSAVHEVSSMQRLLANLVRGKHAPASEALARHVHRAVLARGREELPLLPDRGVKSAMFYVLVGARMPAVLLEASFLTQAEEQEALLRESYRTRLAKGIAQGILAYAQERAYEGSR